MHNGMQKAEIEERRTAVELARIHGFRSVRAIRERLADQGIEASVGTIHNDLQALDAEYQEINRDFVEKERRLAVQRIEEQIQRQHQNLRRIDEARLSGEPEYTLNDTSVSRLIMDLERSKAKLLGLDKPSKIAHTDPTGEREAQGGEDRVSFLERWIQRQREMQAKAEEAEKEEIIDAEVVEEIE